MKKFLLAALAFLAALSSATAQVTILPDVNQIKPGGSQPITLRIQNAGGDLNNVPLSMGITQPGFTFVANPDYNSAGPTTAYKFITISAGATYTQIFYIQCPEDTEVNTYNSFFPRLSGASLGPISVEVVATASASLSKTEFIARTGETDSAILTITNDALSSSLQVALSSAEAWLNFPATLTVPVGFSTNVTVTADANATGGAGNFLDTLTVSYLNNSSPETTLPVSFSAGSYATPSVSTNALALNVIEGETNAATLFLNNSGNAPVDFTLIGNAVSTNSPYADYQETYLTENSETFYPLQFSPETVFADNDWDGTSTLLLALGFSTTIYGNTYTNFIANLDGSLQLTDGTHSVDVLSGYTGEDFEPTWMRYKKYEDHLVVAWGVDPGNSGFDAGELQIWVYANGTTRFLYSRGGSSSTAWYSGLLAPQKWISASPTAGTVLGGGDPVPVTFTFNADSQPIGTEQFSTDVLWSNGQTNHVIINVFVGGLTQQLDLPAASDFYGQAGQITRTNIAVTNSGNSALSYELFYSSRTYTAQQIDYANQWIAGGTTVQTDELGTKAFDIGFPFTFFGKVYTDLIINKNGSITLDDDHVIQVFSNDLKAGENATVTFRTDIAGTQAVITWNNFSPSKLGGNDTFQAVLNRDGTIRCNYALLASDWPDAIIGITDGVTDTTGSLSNDTTVILTTNEEIYVSSTNSTTIGGVTHIRSYNYTTNETVTTMYADPVIHQALQFTPDTRQIITASPLTGTIKPGQSSVIQLIGDARSLNDGGSSNVTVGTTLNFTYSENTSTLDVTFTATNSTDTAYPQLTPDDVALMWGTASEPKVSTEQAGLGSPRTLFWPAPNDGLSRTYRVWYTDSLAKPFEPIDGAVISNGFQFTDKDPGRINSEHGFYKVSVE